uniref:Integrin alpha-3-like n=1 Tax=Salarias fasciatus TaxID=181472 RepID=A0A672IUD5_SALFA
MSARLLLCAAVALYHGTRTCGGFNIDERFPVIKVGKTKGSFFGFSVALHEQTVGSRKHLLLAGAPKERSQSLPNVNETGAVYSCPVTANPGDCSRMDLVTTSKLDMVEGMWLGVTVASQRAKPGGRVLACGHRYMKIIKSGNEEQRRMIGKCYVRSNDLTFDPNDLWQAESYELCDPNYDMEFEGMCTMGVSAGMTETDIYIGTPGSHMWKGNVHIMWRNPDPDKFYESAGKQFVPLKKRYSYMGYSVLEEKKVLSRDEYTVVTGSPRNESKGAVVLGTTSTEIEPVQIIPGEQVGSYFGNSLAIADLNNDDWNDLIVGAPFYFDRMKDEGGAVYIFMNENGSFQNKATVVLKGPSGSAFGLAVAAIGDINQDGFQDFAVGAPFVDTGRVYIWTGNKQGISREPSQVIEGKSVDKAHFHTFGYSISGGVDMDGNSYPDILVGSLDDRIALLRARPVIHLTKDFDVEPKVVDPSQCPGKTPCITASLCTSFTLSNGNKDFKKSIIVNFTVKADIERRRSHRVRFLSNNDDVYSGQLSLQSTKTSCRRLELFLEEPLRDKLEPVVFSLNLTLHEHTPTSKRLQNLDFHPVLSQEQNLTHATIQFQKECGTDNKCTSNLQVAAQYVDHRERPFRRSDFQVLQFNKNMKILRLKVEVTNFESPGRLAEDAHDAELNVTLPSALSYSAVRYEVRPPGGSSRTVLCNLGNPLKGNEKVTLVLWFETKRITLYTHELETQENASLFLPSFRMKPLVETQFGGTVMGESAMVNTSDVGSLVEFTFAVAVEGEPLGDLDTLALELEWPFEVLNGKWLLYLTKIVVETESETECNPPGDVVNMLNLTVRLFFFFFFNPAEPECPDKHKKLTTTSVLRDCSMGTARCVTFTCPLLNMSNSAKVHVRSRLWNSTMLEDYANALRVQVKGQATLKLITDEQNIKLDSQTTQFTVYIEPVEGVETPYELPLWIIISAAVAGILLLGIIILIMWKFIHLIHLASRREMYEAKAQKAEMKIQPSETERLTEDY